MGNIPFQIQSFPLLFSKLLKTMKLFPVRQVVIVMLLSVLYMVPAYPDTPIRLHQLLAGIQPTHPFLQKERLRDQIEALQAKSTAGRQDWVWQLGSFVRQDEPLQLSPFSPKSISTQGIQTGFKKKFWETGGSLELKWMGQHFDQNIPTLQGVTLGQSRFFQHAISLSYSQPLFKNLGGSLDRLPYDLSQFSRDMADLDASENQEQFILDISRQFLTWSYLSEQKRIAKKRYSLARKALTQTHRKFKSNLVDKVDVIRAKDALKQAEQRSLMAKSKWRAKRAELAILTQRSNLYKERPSYRLFSHKFAASLPSGNIGNKRFIRILSFRKQILERQQQAMAEHIKPSLSLDIKGELAGGDPSFSKANALDKTNSELSLNYSQPLGNTSATADLERVKIQILQLDKQIEFASLQHESALANVRIQIRELERMLALHRVQVRLAKEKTREETRFYNQGRSQLTFVIQAQDSEQNAQLAYAQNALKYHQLLLVYYAMQDQLVGFIEGQAL